MPAKKEVPAPPTRREILRENEMLLRAAIQDAEPQLLAQLARELRATAAEIAAVEAEQPSEVSIADQLKAKRDAKLAAVNPAPAARRSQPRRSNGSHRTG